MTQRPSGDPVLPSGWTRVSLETLASREPNAITDGPFGSNLKTAHYTPEGPRVVRLQNVGDAEFVDARAHISDGHYQRLSKHAVRAGDLVIAMLGERLPRACLVPESLGPAIVKADCAKFSPNPACVDPRYLMYALNSPPIRATVVIHGVGRPRLKLSEVKAIEVPLAPRPEQDRIVAEIEKHFTRLDAAVAALKRVQANLKRYRASVLKAACEGRLVPTEAERARREGRTYETGEELLRRLLCGREPRGRSGIDESTVEGRGSLPEGWAWATLSEIARRVTDGTHLPPPFAASGIPFIFVQHIICGRITFTGTKFISRSTYEELNARCPVEPGDILYTAVGSYGTAVLVATNQPFAFQRHIAHIKPMAGVHQGYVVHCLNSPLCRAQAHRVARGVAQKTVTLGDLSRFIFPLPPFVEQQRIAEEVDRRLSVEEELADQVKANLRRASILRQTMLRTAFEGRLVSPNPRDETASALLERIRPKNEATTGSTNAHRRSGPRQGKRGRSAAPLFRE